MNFTFKIGDKKNEAGKPEILGAKAYSLHKMSGNGFLVPDGFIVGAPAMEYFMDSNNFGNIEQIPAGSFPDDLEREIMAAMESTSLDRVAVRSSSDAEDSATRSFAGQFDSFLAVDKENVLGAVKNCWRSLRGPRVLAYSADGGKPAKMAVIVQKMVCAQVSGVSFSMDPVTGDREKIIIEAVAGSNELLVQGLANPDRYEADKDLRILDIKTVFQKEALIFGGQKNGLERTQIESDQQKLNDAGIKSVAALTGRLKDFFGTDVDVEWAIEGGRLYVLQCRPVTFFTDGN